MSKTKLPFPVKRGYPLPLGVTVLNEGINFAIFARHATTVHLLVNFDGSSTEAPHHYELSLPAAENRTGDIWHILLATTNCNLTYGYRCDGPTAPTTGLDYDPTRVLIDPYCQALLARSWGEDATYGLLPCCRIIRHDFDWRGDRPLKIPLNDTIIYEMHVRGFTRGENAQVEAAGTYRGVIAKIPYLKTLGITAVELMPVTEFDENDTVFRHPESGERLKNFWGYNPVSFFALKSGYAADPENHINEFKEMVRSLHQAGIEVILDIVFNHTGEGGYDGITSSFRGFDNPIFYLLNQHSREYLNFSGCGNTMNCNHPIVRSMIKDALRYWVMEMHVDGFRFDLASILGRDKEGHVLPNPPMIEIIAEDPILRDSKIIAEAWDAAGLYQVGSFSSDSRWAEWNGRFRDDVRAFMTGHDGAVTRLATRFAGSSDLYRANRRGPLCSINFLTSHDGFTLADLVSFDHKHNLANGENNRDGDNHNLSWNSGYEGEPCPAAVKELRLRRMRSMIVILLLSQGVPMITAGDEFGRSQGGNNNAWCQDNETGWIDWSYATSNLNLLRFFRECIDLRRRHPVFRRDDFFPEPGDTATTGHGPEISWQYLQPGQENWADDCHGLGILIHGQRQGKPRDDDFFIMVNGDRQQTLTFRPPEVPVNHAARHWHRIIDTAAPSPEDVFLPDAPLSPAELHGIAVQPLAVVILQSQPTLIEQVATPYQLAMLHKNFPEESLGQ